MVDEKETQNGKVEEKMVGQDTVREFLQKHYGEMNATLPDFGITLIARNTKQQGADIIISTDHPDNLIGLLQKAKAHLEQQSPSPASN